MSQKIPNHRELNKNISTPFKALPLPTRCKAAGRAYTKGFAKTKERLEKERQEEKYEFAKVPTTQNATKRTRPRPITAKLGGKPAGR